MLQLLPATHSAKAQSSPLTVCALLVPCRYVKFDTFHPAVERGLPVTRVIGRVNLQEVLAEAVTR